MILPHIFDKLIYNEIYPIIDIGGLQKINIRDHLFIMFGIVNDVINGKGDDTDIQMFDSSKCFDSLWLKETLNDVYDAGIRNNYLALLYEENKKTSGYF